MHLNCLSQYEAFSANWGNPEQKLQIGNWVLAKGRFVFPCILSEVWVQSKWQSVTTADWHLPDLHLEKQIEKKAGQTPLGERFPVGSSARRHKRLGFVDPLGKRGKLFRISWPLVRGCFAIFEIEWNRFPLGTPLPSMFALPYLTSKLIELDSESKSGKRKPKPHQKRSQTGGPTHNRWNGENAVSVTVFLCSILRPTTLQKIHRKLVFLAAYFGFLVFGFFYGNGKKTFRRHFVYLSWENPVPSARASCCCLFYHYHWQFLLSGANLFSLVLPPVRWGLPKALFLLVLASVCANLLK